MDGCQLGLVSEWLRYQVRKTIGLKGRIKEEDKLTVKTYLLKSFSPV